MDENWPKSFSGSLLNTKIPMTGILDSDNSRNSKVKFEGVKNDFY